jgi:hypothetical protein
LTLEAEMSRCKEDRTREVDRYYQTVLLTIGLKDYLDARGKACRFVSSEPRFFNEKHEEVKPDVVLQYGSSNILDYGVLCEIKTSLPFPEGYLIDSLKQIER